jgi:hypothetical protein
MVDFSFGVCFVDLTMIVRLRFLEDSGAMDFCSNVQFCDGRNAVRDDVVSDFSSDFDAGLSTLGIIGAIFVVDSPIRQNFHHLGISNKAAFSSSSFFP